MMDWWIGGGGWDFLDWIGWLYSAGGRNGCILWVGGGIGVDWYCGIGWQDLLFGLALYSMAWLEDSLSIAIDNKN